MPAPQTPGEMEAAMLKGLKEATGYDFDEIMAAIEQSGFEKHGQIQKFLNKDVWMKYGYASVMAAIFLNGKKPVYGDPDALLKEQYEKIDQLRPVYDELATEIKKRHPEVKLGVCKGYVSVLSKAQCATINPRKDGVWVAMSLPSHEEGGKLVNPKKLKATPKLNVAMVLNDQSDLNPEFYAYLDEAIGNHS